jgi:hypothetical protein
MAKILGRNTVVGIIVFVSLWLTFCVIDTLRGVRAGYSIQAEIMIHLLLFAIPAVAAYLAARLLH